MELQYWSQRCMYIQWKYQNTPVLTQEKWFFLNRESVLKKLALCSYHEWGGRRQLKLYLILWLASAWVVIHMFSMKKVWEHKGANISLFKMSGCSKLFFIIVVASFFFLFNNFIEIPLIYKNCLYLRSTWYFHTCMHYKKITNQVK